MATLETKYTFFWRKASPFSQWHPSSYTLDGHEYSCAEQGMMHGKALLFGDEEIAARILETNDPKKIKALGRQVKDFTHEQWQTNREIIVYRNSVAKFTQNEHLRKALLKTTGLLVEASPHDKIWGIGLCEDEARKVPESKWRGLNLLGKILTRTREDILADGRGELRVGDLLDLASNGEFDVIVHGCNCFNTMGAGIAKSIKTRWPEVYKADLVTEKGSREKLGTYTQAVICGENGNHNFVVVNAYTQYHWKHGIGDSRCCVDYNALSSVFKQIKKDFTGKRIGYPMIGAGLAGGNWDIIRSIIKRELDGEKHTFVRFDETARAPLSTKQQQKNRLALQRAKVKENKAGERETLEEKVLSKKKSASDIAADPTERARKLEKSIEVESPIKSK